MYTIFVVVKVKPGQGEAFQEASRRNRVGARRESGNVRFDLLRAAQPAEDPDAPEVFYLFEVYRSLEDFQAHQQTDHYHAFRAEVANMMAEPRVGMQAVSIDADPWE